MCDIGSEAKCSWNSTFCFGLWEEYIRRLKALLFLVTMLAILIFYPFFSDASGTKSQPIGAWRTLQTRLVNSLSSARWLSSSAMLYRYRFSLTFLERSYSGDCVWSSLTAFVGWHQRSDCRSQRGVKLPFAFLWRFRNERRLCVKYTDHTCGLSSAQRPLSTQWPFFANAPSTKSRRKLCVKYTCHTCGYKLSSAQVIQSSS